MITGSGLRATLGCVLAASLCAACVSDTSTRNLAVTHDGLVRIAHPRVERAWVKPDADFSQYTEVTLLDCFVSFRRNWQMRHSGVRTSDMERIKRELSDQFRQVFSEALANGDHPVVAEAAEHVLLIRPAIIDLNIAAPQTNWGGRYDSFTTSPGTMTLIIELYDSVSNEILARAIDRRRARNVGNIRWTTSGTNRDAARKILRRWANLLVTRLDEFSGKQDD